MALQYTKEQRTAALKIDLYEFLLKYHYELFKKDGQRYLKYKNNPSIIIGKGKNGYKDCATSESGNNIEFLVNYLNYDIPNAIYALTNGEFIKEQSIKSHTEPQLNLPPEFPEPLNGTYKNLYAYLLKRGIHKDTIQMLIDKKLIYQEAKNNNIVFANKERTWGEIRGTLSEKSFHGMIKNSKHTGFWFFQVGAEKSKNVFICEAAIDAISLYEIRKLKNELSDDVYISIGGVAKQDTINLIKKSRHVIIAVDNDEAGKECRIRNSDCESIIPKLKDWNEDLLEWLKNQ